MPTYEYRCSSCGCTFDEFHGMSDDSPRECPECGEDAEKVIGAGSGIIFKGSGFYANDYARVRENGRSGCGDGSGCPHGDCCLKED